MSYFFSESEEGVAKGMDAMSVLDNAETRNQILNELLEVCGLSQLEAWWIL